MYIGPADNALFLINSRTGADIKMICSLMKDSPSGLIGLDDTIPRGQASTRHIGRADLIGHRIGMTPGADYLTSIIYAGLNIAPGDMQVMKSGATPDALMGGAIDYYAGFRTNQTRILERQGYKNWTFFPYADLGLHDYFDVSMVNADFYHQQPQLLANYVYALNESILYEIAHPDEAADIAVRYTAEYPVANQERDSHLPGRRLRPDPGDEGIGGDPPAGRVLSLRPDRAAPRSGRPLIANKTHPRKHFQDRLFFYVRPDPLP
jgi:ABC-type nitrate/sulfonate/bicarbonate transport system substrate-binding protein